MATAYDTFDLGQALAQTQAMVGRGGDQRLAILSDAAARQHAERMLAQSQAGSSQQMRERLAATADYDRKERREALETQYMTLYKGAKPAEVGSMSDAELNRAVLEFSDKQAVGSVRADLKSRNDLLNKATSLINERVTAQDARVKRAALQDPSFLSAVSEHVSAKTAAEFASGNSTISMEKLLKEAGNDAPAIQQAFIAAIGTAATQLGSEFDPMADATVQSLLGDIGLLNRTIQESYQSIRFPENREGLLVPADLQLDTGIRDDDNDLYLPGSGNANPTVNPTANPAGSTQNGTLLSATAPENQDAMAPAHLTNFLNMAARESRPQPNPFPDFGMTNKNTPPASVSTQLPKYSTWSSASMFPSQQQQRQPQALFQEPLPALTQQPGQPAQPAPAQDPFMAQRVQSMLEQTFGTADQAVMDRAKAMAIRDGMSEQQIQELTQGALQGDPQARAVANAYIQRASGGTAPMQ